MFTFALNDNCEATEPATSIFQPAVAILPRSAQWKPPRIYVRIWRVCRGFVFCIGICIFQQESLTTHKYVHILLCVIAQILVDITIRDKEMTPSSIADALVHERSYGQSNGLANLNLEVAVKGSC